MVIVQELHASDVCSSRVSVGSAVATIVPSIETMRIAVQAVAKTTYRRRPAPGAGRGRRSPPPATGRTARSDCGCGDAPRAPPWYVQAGIRPDSCALTTRGRTAGGGLAVNRYYPGRGVGGRPEDL